MEPIQFNSSLQKLTQLEQRSCTPDDVREVIKDLAILCVPFYIQKGAYILRARKGGGLKKRKDMTYCPVEKCNSYQRATLPGYTMFYGVISDDQTHQDHARAVATSECSVLCREGINSIGREIFSIAHWEVVKPLHVVSLITPNTYSSIQEN